MPSLRAVTKIPLQTPLVAVSLVEESGSGGAQVVRIAELMGVTRFLCVLEL